MTVNKLFAGKILTPLVHVLFWGLIIISPYLFRNPNTYQGMNSWNYRIMINNVLLGAFFYFNAYLLYPVLYKQKKLLLYIFSLILTVATILFISRSIDGLLFPFQGRHLFPTQGRPITDHLNDSINRRNKQVSGNHNKLRYSGSDRRWFGWYFTNMLTYIFITGISFSYRIITDNSRQEKAIKERENENLKTELSFLRSQVSPHFIFNVLNNLVLLARKKSDMLEPSLIELSQLMRYTVYENDEERVLLSREIAYLKNYISLQMLRFEDDVTLAFHFPDHVNTYYIEPMLLVPFIENAFKHGVGLVKDPKIDILLQIDAGGWLDFKVTNTIAPLNDAKDKTSGIGLVNLRRRLELLYKKDYQLNISQDGLDYIAALKLKLN